MSTMSGNADIAFLLLKTTLKGANSTWISPETIEQLSSFAKNKNELSLRINFMTGLIDVIRKMKPDLFTSEDIRAQLCSALQERLDAFILEEEKSQE